MQVLWHLLRHVVVASRLASLQPLSFSLLELLDCVAVAHVCILSAAGIIGNTCPMIIFAQHPSCSGA